MTLMILSKNNAPDDSHHPWKSLAGIKPVNLDKGALYITPAPLMRQYKNYNNNNNNTLQNITQDLL